MLGGPSHCCGVVQMRPGDVATSGRFAENTMDKLARSKSGQVVSWCPSCHVQFTTTLPTVEKTRGSKPFEMTRSCSSCAAISTGLTVSLKPVPMRVALHRHPGLKGVVEAAEDILHAAVGVDLVDLGHACAMSNYFARCRRIDGIAEERARCRRARRRRCVGRGLSRRPSRAVRARTRLPVPDHELYRDRRRQHGASPRRSLQAAQELQDADAIAPTATTWLRSTP